MMKKRRLPPLGPFALAILATMLFGSNAVALKVASESLDPLVYVTFRMLGSGLVLLLFLKGFTFLRDTKVFLHVLLSGGILLLGMLLYAPGVEQSGALKASVFGLTIPVFIYVFSVFLLHEPYIRRVMLGGIVALLGSIVLVGLPLFFGSSLQTGDLLLLGAFMSISAAIIHAKYLLTWLTPNQIISCRFFVAGIGLLAFVVMFRDPSIMLEGEPVAWLMVLYGVLVTGVIANTIYYRALRHMKAEQAAPLFYLDPLTGALLAALVLGERLEITALIGALIIIGGVAISHPHHVRLFYHYHIPIPRGPISYLKGKMRKALHLRA